MITFGTLMSIYMSCHMCVLVRAALVHAGVYTQTHARVYAPVCVDVNAY